MQKLKVTIWLNSKSWMVVHLKVTSFLNQLIFSGEIIPIRLFLKGFNFTPTMDNVNNKFSVKYFVNLVLVDEDERRYFK